MFSEDVADKCPYFRCKDHKGPEPRLKCFQHWWGATKATTTSFSRWRRKIRRDSRSGWNCMSHWLEFHSGHTIFRKFFLWTFTLFVMLENRWRTLVAYSFNEGCFASRSALIWPSMIVKRASWDCRQIDTCVHPLQVSKVRAMLLQNIFISIYKLEKKLPLKNCSMWSNNRSRWEYFLIVKELFRGIYLPKIRIIVTHQNRMFCAKHHF